VTYLDRPIWYLLEERKPFSFTDVFGMAMLVVAGEAA
jgi:hypothetical protein